MMIQVRIALSRSRSAVLLILVLLSACSPAPASTPFRPPTAEAPLIEPTFLIQPTQEILVIEDLTIPDNMFATFGLALDKQWLVENSGTCNWNAAYRLRNVGGAALGAPGEIALYPARAGTQATLRILFTAPFAEGVYESAWQAMDANGSPFGDPIYIRVAVQ
jgi:hypothetical protein